MPGQTPGMPATLERSQWKHGWLLSDLDRPVDATKEERPGKRQDQFTVCNLDTKPIPKLNLEASASFFCLETPGQDQDKTWQTPGSAGN